MFTSLRLDIADNIQPDIISSNIDVETAKLLARHVKQRYEWQRQRKKREERKDSERREREERVATSRKELDARAEIERKEREA